MRSRPVADVADPEARVPSIRFNDNALCALLFGQHHENLARLEQKLSVSLVARGNEVTLHGDAGDTQLAETVLKELYAQLERGLEVGPEEVNAAVRLARDPGGLAAADEPIRTERRVISARSPNQLAYIRALRERELVLALGPAGTGKTYLAVAMAVAMLRQRRVDRVVLSRPAVEAGERLGFLPGDMKEKVDPYLRPLYDALQDMLPAGKLASRLESGQIEIAPLAFMRGRTLSNAFVILDEAQNSSPGQMKMFLTRLGENSRMVVTGDPTQTDLPADAVSGLADAVDRLQVMDGIAICRFDKEDIVRHPLVSAILEAYDRRPPATAIGKG